CGRGYAMDYW
nr:immunoglobulin heavy chain junction region [Mus musculus]